MNSIGFEFSSLDCLPLHYRRLMRSDRQFPCVSALYFVMSGNTIVYIGETNNLLGRWSPHGYINKFREYQCDKVAWLECHRDIYSKSDRKNIETKLIRFFRPALNRKCNPDVPQIRTAARLNGLWHEKTQETK